MPILLVRHASAGAPGSWPGRDAERPLDDRGRRQAERLVGALLPFSVGRVLSSPAARCLATVGPVASTLGLAVEPREELFEGASPEALDLVRSLLAPGSAVAPAAGPSVVLCSHGDVVPDVLRWLARDGATLGGDRRCQKASTWVLHGEPGSLVAGSYLAPPA